MRKATVQVARRLIRARVQLCYAMALAWGNYPAAEAYKAWLDNDVAQLYPPTENV